MPRSFRSAACFAAFTFCAGVVSASNFSFTGTFATDDQTQVFTFDVLSPSTVVMETWEYAGGTNQAGTLIPRGGLDPFLALFDPGGNLIAQNDDGTGIVAIDPITGNGFDSYLSELLPTGTYKLVLSQAGNQPLGNAFSDGYSSTGLPNFTSQFACSNGIFCDVSTDNRTGNWALDIINVNSVSTGAAVPEPNMLGWLGAGLLGILLRRRAVKT